MCIRDSVESIKYFRHYIASDFSNDIDILREIRNMFFASVQTVRGHIDTVVVT